jgi:hypothetical protein
MITIFGTNHKFKFGRKEWKSLMKKRIALTSSGENIFRSVMDGEIEVR